MARLRFIDVQSRPTEFLDVTSLTLEEFAVPAAASTSPLVPMTGRSGAPSRRWDAREPCPPAQGYFYPITAWGEAVA